MNNSKAPRHSRGRSDAALLSWSAGKAFASLTLAVLLAAPAVRAESFRFRGAMTETGSLIRPVIGEASVPLEKDYASLSDAERTALRAAHPKLLLGDEPPYLDSPLKPLLTALQRLRTELGLRESLQLQLSIDARGEVVSIRAVPGANEKLTALVAQSLYAARFRPAQCAGSPCSSELPIDLQVFGKGSERRD